jgi:RND superfamily putative drug exporter
MSSLLGRLGRITAAHPWRTVIAWVLLLVLAQGLAAGFGAAPQDDYRVDGSPSQLGADLLAERFGELSGADARVVVHDRDSGRIPESTLTALGMQLAGVEHVSQVSPPRISADGDTALITVQYDVPVTEFTGSDGVDALRAATAGTERAGLQVELGGQLPENFTAPSGTAEAIGIVAALIILVFAFGSMIAAGLPLAVALAGLGLGFAGISLLGRLIDVSSTAPTIASMVGLGVGIDYALLLVTRYAEGLRSGLDRVGAAARANATAGMSVIFAGTTVLASLLGLGLAGLSTYATFGYATLLAVLAIMLASVTLVPALCALAGERVLSRAVRRDRAAALAQVTHPAVDASPGEGQIAGQQDCRLGRRAAGGATGGSDRPVFTARWAARVGRRPLPWAIGATVLLLALAAPVLDLRTWPQDAGSQPTSSTTRLAYDLVADEFGPGANGPLLIVAETGNLGTGGLEALGQRIAAQDGVEAVTPPLLDAAGRTAVFTVQPTTGPQDEATTQLLDRLRSDVLPDGAHVTGITAVFADISDRLAERLWLVVGFVVALSLVLLTAVFRSVVVSIKAALMNLLSVSAAYGVMVMIFQWGWGAELVGLPHAVPVSSWVPILMFAILFGLSMDYEVFLLSRIREDWLATGDARGSVIRGLASTGRVITSAAAIMIAVFVGFALDPDVTVKMTGLGMAVAVAIDATIVRMVLVPATMAMLGRANWWLPGWLDRLLPAAQLPVSHTMRASATAFRVANGQLTDGERRRR